ncbi:MAG: proline--tRNA ligase [Chlamydiae bacterium CG10_big_fil_rev_8_21_14_0_10_35_9]|nr:MAG: proline--tRNA ligase [Chlamydiae bacterium CG10_big_fil_rev_8_21_14_0_10_35_9]
MKNAIYPTREEDYPEWYQQVIKAADLAEHSPVRGAMVIKPWGFSIWENMQKQLDKMFKELDVQNAYFPLFIPLSFLEKEAKHVEGFATECAVVTHHRLQKNKDGSLVPASKLDEPLIVRPTSEMIIGYHFSKWIQSYRDLPLKINQWANVVRWEMRTRLFLRTSEILWQEGHTAHATDKEADEQAIAILKLYETFVREYLAIPLLIGEKSESEKFPGAEKTYTMEAMMQDKKALQMGTSHFLGQNFAKSCDIQFQDEEGDKKYAWTTSWGVTTRLIGALIMSHSDDDGLVLPPKIAAVQIVILPIMHKEESKDAVLSFCKTLQSELEGLFYHDKKLKVILDDRNMRGGEKNWSWVKKGVPIRLEIGPKDIEESSVMVMKRNTPVKEKQKQTMQAFKETVCDQLDEIQKDLYEKANAQMEQHLVPIEDKEEFYRFFASKNEKKSFCNGFAISYFSLNPELEKLIKEELNVTVRCIPFDFKEDKGECIFTKKPNSPKVIFAKAY